LALPSIGLAGMLLLAPHRATTASPPTASAPLGPRVARPTASTPNCTTGGCHDAIIHRPTMHGPVAQGKCHSCHVEADPRAHTFRDAMPRERMCVTCHVLPVRDTVHAPVAVGDCTGCHDPHGSAHPMLLRADPATALCATCHDPADYTRKRHIHGPVAAGACILCHEVHSSWHKGLLKRAPQEQCLTCHGEVLAAIRERRHSHAALTAGICTDCHEPHASDHRGQLKASGAELCTDCHEPIRYAIQTAAVVHGPAAGPDACVGCHVGHASDLPKLQRGPQPAACLDCHNQPLRDAQSNPIADMAALLRENSNHHGPIRDGNCTACHDPHASANFRLLTTAYPPDFYAPFDLERYKLCFSCHRPEMATEPDGTGVTGFRDGTRNLHALHVNQEKGRTCRACHEVHASNRPFHIRESVPFGKENWKLEINFTQSASGGSCAPGCHKPETYDREAGVVRTRGEGTLP
jgi:predicted CXXCH cytochrome family protein